MGPGVADGGGPGGVAAGSFRPSSQDDLAPSGAVSRARANLAALTTLRAIEREARPATPDEQQVLARWSGWGAVPEVFDTRRAEYAWAREQLGALLGPREMAAAARNTLNAHYTGAGIVQATWSAVQALGFTGGRVLEPGCGSGNFIGFAPAAAQVTGVELDPVTAAIAAALHPRAQILAESFADTGDPDGSYDLAIGNVPFGKAALHDRRHNLAGHSIVRRLAARLNSEASRAEAGKAQAQGPIEVIETSGNSGVPVALEPRPVTAPSSPSPSSHPRY